MSQCWAVVRYNLRFSLLPAALLAIGICLLTPVVFGITALDGQAAALPLESMLSFVGVALLTPVFAAEHAPGTLAAVSARRTPYIGVCALRACLALLASALCVACFVLWMRLMESQVTATHALAALSNAVFLGGMGMLVSGLTSNTVLGYMAAVLYFVLDYAGGTFGALSLLHMTREGTAAAKPLLLALGLLMVGLALGGRYWRLRRG